MNSITFTAWVSVIFAVCGMLSLFYWFVVRRVLVRVVKFQLFAKRDRLRMMAIEKMENPKSFAYTDLEDYICKVIAYMPSLSLAQFIWFLWRADSGPSEDF